MTVEDLNRKLVSVFIFLIGLTALSGLSFVLWNAIHADAMPRAYYIETRRMPQPYYISDNDGRYVPIETVYVVRANIAWRTDNDVEIASTYERADSIKRSLESGVTLEKIGQ